MSKRYRVIEGEPEMQCRKCKEWWPADHEFYHKDKRAAYGLSPVCKACYAEYPSQQRRREKDNNQTKEVFQ